MQECTNISTDKMYVFYEEALYETGPKMVKRFLVFFARQIHVGLMFQYWGKTKLITRVGDKKRLILSPWKNGKQKRAIWIVVFTCDPRRCLKHSSPSKSKERQLSLYTSNYVDLYKKVHNYCIQSENLKFVLYLKTCKCA